MKRDEATAFVKKNLGQGKSDSEIARDLSVVTTLSEDQAKRFVAHIRRNLPPSSPSSISTSQLSDLETYVISNLAKNRNPNDIVMYVAENSGMNWKEAEIFVLQVTNRHSKSITRRQAPFELPMALGTALFGLLILLAGLLLLALAFTGNVALSSFDDLRTLIYVPFVLLVGLGMLISGGRSAKKQLDAIDAPGKFYQQAERVLVWVFQNWILAVGGLVALFVVAFIVFQIFRPRLSPSITELAQHYVDAVNRGNRSEALGLYGPQDICEEPAGRISRPGQDYDQVTTALAGESLIVTSMELANWSNPPTDDWQWLDVYIQQTASGMISLTIYTRACSRTRRCICDVDTRIIE